MLTSLLPILPSLGLLVIIILGYFVFKQKMNEYNQKFASMFSLLSAMTDEINKLKANKLNSIQYPILVDDQGVEETEYESEDDEDDSEGMSGEESEDSEESEEESEEEEDEEEEDEDEEDEEEEEEEKKKKLEENENRNDEETKQIDAELYYNDNDIKKAEEFVSTTIDLDNEQKNIQVNSFENIDYSKMLLKDLRSLAKQRGLGGENTTQLKKQELIDLLNDKSIKIE